MPAIDTLAMSDQHKNPFKLDDLGETLPPSVTKSLPLLENLTGLGTLGILYDELEASHSEVDFLSKALSKLQVVYQIHGE